MAAVVVRAVETKFKPLIPWRRRERCNISSPTQTNVSKSMKADVLRNSRRATRTPVLFNFDFYCIFLPSFSWGEEGGNFLVNGMWRYEILWIRFQIK